MNLIAPPSIEAKPTLLPKTQSFFSWYLLKYLNKEVLVGFMVGSVIFLFIMLMFQVIRLSDFLVMHQVSLIDIGNLLLGMLLSFVPITLPAAFLFATLMGVARANSEGEVMALQVSGIRMAKIFLPIFFLSVCLSFLCLYLSLYVVPQGNRRFEILFTKLANQHVISSLKPGVFIRGFYGLVLFTEQIFPNTNELRNVMIYDDRESSRPLFIVASSGVLKTDLDKAIVTLRLSEGQIYFDQNEYNPIQRKIVFHTYDINLSMGQKDEGERDYSPPSYNYPQLKNAIKNNEHKPVIKRTLQIELHRRLSLSFACIVFACLGFFTGILSQRGIRSSAIIFCMVVALIYWVCYLAANAMATSGWVPPWMSIWAPNLIFIWVSFLCYQKYLRR